MHYTNCCDIDLKRATFLIFSKYCFLKFDMYFLQGIMGKDHFASNNNLQPLCIESGNDMKIFIVLSESPLKVKKIAVYCFLISFIVPELSRFKDLKNDQKNGMVLDKINQK